MFRTYIDPEGDVVFVVFGVLYLTFYKAHKNRNPIVTWLRGCR